MEPGEYVEMRLLCWAPSLEVLRARYTTFEFPTHAHAEFTIGEVLRGTELFAHLGRAVAAPSGWFFHLNPSEAHDGRAAHCSWSYVSLYPSVEFLRRAMPELFAAGEPCFARPVSHRPRLRGRIGRFVAQVFAAADELTLQSDLFAILADLFQSARAQPGPAPGSQRSAAVARVRERLSDEWAGNVGLLELASSVSLTPLALMRAFRREVGCTPQTFRTTRRLEVARGLLRQGGQLAAVALRCGFSDQSHFTNTFRRWTGLTPGEYRAVARSSCLRSA
jgi:AraC-like DNA-binding protein